MSKSPFATDFNVTPPCGGKLNKGPIMAAKNTPTSQATEEAPEVAATTSAAPDVAQAQLLPEDDPMASTPVQAAFMITLQEFMQKLSARDNRIGLVNGFY